MKIEIQYIKLFLVRFFSTTFLTFFIIINVIAQSTEKLTFSHKRGFYENNFNLTISMTTLGVLIKFTLDGSDPLLSSSAIIQNSPVVIPVNPGNTAGRDRAPGFCVRAVAIQNDTAVTIIKTHTYIFIKRVVELSTDNQRPGSNWLQQTTSGSSQYINYGMDPQVYNDPLYKGKIVEALLDIPTFSMVMDLKDLFDPNNGIYVNALEHGAEWERPCSIELIHPDGKDGFQINAGVRIRGGWSRHNDCPKRAFRWFFRKEYGEAKLKYPLFGDEGVDEFDKMDLRTSMNYSWSYAGSNLNTLNRDVFSRDVQRDMGVPYTRSRYYHLYINGTYWGLYQTQERSEASFASYYFGGNREDYDVIKVATDAGYNIEATDGTLDAWRRLWNASMSGFDTDETYYKIQGKNPDGTINPNYEVLLDLDNLIDYMLCTFLVGDYDGPISSFSGNVNPNNFYAIYNRNARDGFIFFRHDAEHSLRNHSWGYDRTGPYPAGSQFKKSNPQWLHQKLMEHPRYRIRFSDHVYKHFFNAGALTPEVNKSRFMARKEEIDLAIIAESTRWGDSKKEPAFTRNNAWLPAINWIIKDFFPTRTSLVLNQLKNKDLFPQTMPPEFNSEGGRIESDLQLTMKAPEGKIYYTINSTDPLISDLSSGNNISQNAIEYIDPILINKSTFIRARTLNGTDWSPINDVQFWIAEGFDNLKITEIHYHPLDESESFDNDGFYEFIELKNIGAENLDISGLQFSRGIQYTFPLNTNIQSGQFIVLAAKDSTFSERYGFSAFGEYEGQLANNGETIALTSLNGDTLVKIKYNDKYPWPQSTDGDGFSLVTKDIKPYKNQNDPENWIASSTIHGTPGSDDSQVSVDDQEKNIPSEFKLFQNYPNPFNPSTTFKFSLSKTNRISLKVYNILGQLVDTIVEGHFPEGAHKVMWNASNLAGGIYFYRLEVEDFIASKKLLLVK